MYLQVKNVKKSYGKDTSYVQVLKGIYIAALMCTHIAAFRVQANLRSGLMRRILMLPLGVFDEDGTGKIRRIVNESTAATETFIAHNLPDKAVAAATPVGLLILLAVFDWKMGLICLIPALIGFGFMMSMMGKNMQEKMAEYQNALESMSSEATEYVRGVPVVKVFGQSVHSFRRFKEMIDGFGKWATEYTLMDDCLILKNSTEITAESRSVLDGFFLLASCNFS